jgi:hypothetical protein
MTPGKPTVGLAPARSDPVASVVDALLASFGLLEIWRSSSGANVKMGAAGEGSAVEGADVARRPRRG